MTNPMRSFNQLINRGFVEIIDTVVVFNLFLILDISGKRKKSGFFTSQKSIILQ